MKKSPKINDISWGTTKVEGANGPYKDAKVYPGGSRSWDWNETGTDHSIGVQPEDVQELVENGAKVIVLSKGMNQRLRIQQETLDWLKEQGIETHVYPTDEAVTRYNELADDKPVGALIHSTC